ncbi:MAG: S-layer homology domain-containing protein [Chloroflexi bacterium]|nr:S-layer homology domain-containing protein [Chloroflexota bacterium]
MAVNYVGGLGVSVVLAPVFADVPWDYWAWQDIERLYNSGVTGGCSTNPMYYCPDNSVTRAQMAVFLLKGKYGSTYTPPAVGSSTGFNDVATNYWAAAWIKQLAAEGITSGCSWSPPLYCPESTTTHAQMAIFLLKSKHGSAYTPPAVGNAVIRRQQLLRRLKLLLYHQIPLHLALTFPKQIFYLVTRTYWSGAN